MRDLLNRFSFDSVKFNNQVLLCMILVWVLVLACTVSSILSQEVTSRRRTFWIALITAAPLLGVLIYLPFSFKREDLPFMFQARSTKRRSSSKNRSL